MKTDDIINVILPLHKSDVKHLYSELCNLYNMLSGETWLYRYVCASIDALENKLEVAE